MPSPCGLLKKIVRRVPVIGAVLRDRDRLRQQLAAARLYVPPGHFYSPIPGPADIERRETVSESIADVELNTAGQEQLLADLSRFYSELPFGETQTTGCRYYFNQDLYCYADAIYLYAMLRQFRPRRLIEVGSGFSSAVTLDTYERFLGNSLTCTFIEPYPDRFKKLAAAGRPQPYTLLEQPVQDVPLETFDVLEANDILFIDSSHVSKVGSDVNHLLFHVLPRLRAGVLIHFHDIFYPFEYPLEWLQEGRAWNEAYLVRAFLQNNSTYQILLFASYVGMHFKDLLAEKMPLCLKNTGAALWLQKSNR